MQIGTECMYLEPPSLRVGGKKLLVGFFFFAMTPQITHSARVSDSEVVLYSKRQSRDNSPLHEFIRKCHRGGEGSVYKVW